MFYKVRKQIFEFFLPNVWMRSWYAQIEVTLKFYAKKKRLAIDRCKSCYTGDSLL
jgi:hypothetical protein